MYTPCGKHLNEIGLSLLTEPVSASGKRNQQYKQTYRIGPLYGSTPN
jgi:hypothetical protein